MFLGKRTSHSAITILAAVVVMCALGLGSDVAAQGQRSGRAMFDVVSMKYGGDALARARSRGGYSRRDVEFKGLRLTGDDALIMYLNFAFANLFKPFKMETPQWMRFEYYSIEALAPQGTTLDESRTMLQRTLIDRLGLKYRVVERSTRVLFLLRSSSAVKLAPAGAPEKRDSVQSAWLFKTNRASIADFAAFLSSLATTEVVDKTGLQGYYSINIDLRHELNSGEDPRTVGPVLAKALAKSAGLRLEPGTEMQKVLVVDGANKMPTPN